MTVSDPRTHHATCPHCGTTFEYQRYHAGFSNEGYMYCDQDDTVLTWGTYDRAYTRIVNKVPWGLTADEQRAVEASLKPCPHGGHFAFSNLPRSPSCNGELPDLVPSKIYFAVVGRRVDADKTDVWTDRGVDVAV